IKYIAEPMPHYDHVFIVISELPFFIEDMLQHLRRCSTIDTHHFISKETRPSQAIHLRAILTQTEPVHQYVLYFPVRTRRQKDTKKFSMCHARYIFHLKCMIATA